MHIYEYIVFFGQGGPQNSIRLPFIVDKRILAQLEHKLRNVLVMYRCLGRVADHILEMASRDMSLAKVYDRIKFYSD